MAAPPTEYDYEAIVEEFIKKETDAENLENKKDVFMSGLWVALKNYYEAKSKYELTEERYNKAQRLVSEKKQMKRNLEQEQVYLDRKIENLQKEREEVEAKGRQQRELFHKNMDELYAAFKKLPEKFNDENMGNQIKSNKEAIAELEQKIRTTKKEMQVLMVEMESPTGIDIPDLKEVTQQIQKDSLEWYGDTMKLQIRLSEVKKNIGFLTKKIQDIKVKYDI